MNRELYNRETGEHVATEICEATAGPAPVVPLHLLYRGRVLPVGREPSQQVSVPTHKCSCDHGLTRRKPSKRPCKTCGGKVVRAECKPLDSKKQRITCEPLFCLGDGEQQGFSRTIAIRYLSKRMVYAPKGNAKGHEDAPLTVKARKTSSSRHAMPWFHASDVEDLVQEAFTIWAMGAIKRTGNRLIDTCNACRRAHTTLTRQRQRERKALDVVAYSSQTAEHAERSKRNRTWDDDVEALLSVARLHGCYDQRQLAEALGISEGEVSKRLSRIRDKWFDKSRIVT